MQKRIDPGWVVQMIDGYVHFVSDTLKETRKLINPIRVSSELTNCKACGTLAQDQYLCLDGDITCKLCMEKRTAVN